MTVTGHTLHQPRTRTSTDACDPACRTPQALKPPRGGREAAAENEPVWPAAAEPLQEPSDVDSAEPAAWAATEGATEAAAEGAVPAHTDVVSSRVQTRHNQNDV